MKLCYWLYSEGGASFLWTESNCKFCNTVSSSWNSLSLRNENLKMWCQSKNSVKFCQALSLSRSRCSPQLCYECHAWSGERSHQLFHHCCMKKRNWWCHLCFKPKLERKTSSQETAGQPGEGNWACLWNVSAEKLSAHGSSVPCLPQALCAPQCPPQLRLLLLLVPSSSFALASKLCEMCQG